MNSNTFIIDVLIEKKISSDFQKKENEFFFQVPIYYLSCSEFSCNKFLFIILNYYTLELQVKISFLTSLIFAVNQEINRTHWVFSTKVLHFFTYNFYRDFFFFKYRTYVNWYDLIKFALCFHTHVIFNTIYVCLENEISLVSLIIK